MPTAHFLSPFGCFELSGSELGLRSVRWIDVHPCPAGPIPPELRPAVQQLDEYFKQQRKVFDLRLDWSGAPDFHRAVWEALLRIPYGHTTSYGAIAEQLGDPKSVRAVGQANKHNPIAIIVPCHRVIAKSGELQGYFYGLDFKRRLLALENPLGFAEQGSLF